MEFEIKREEIIEIRKIISKEYNVLQNIIGDLIQRIKGKRKRKISDKNNISIEFNDEKIIYNNTVWAKAHELMWKDLNKVFCKDGYIFLAGPIIKCFYLCNENYFSSEEEKDNFINFLNGKIGSDIISEELKKKKVLTYKKEYKNQDTYIKNIVDERKLTKNSNISIFITGFLFLGAFTIFLENEITKNISVMSVIGMLIMGVTIMIEESSAKRELRNELKDKEEKFESVITLDKVQNCIVVESPREVSKFNIADYIGTYGEYLMFRTGMTAKGIGGINLFNGSVEEKEILSYLKENQYDNEKNREVSKKFKRKTKMHMGILIISCTFIICIFIGLGFMFKSL